MSLKLEMLRTFITVAECGNLQDATARLGRTQSAISMTLKQLERQLGAPLFETDRKSNLTKVGFFVLEQAKEELKQFDGMVKRIQQFSEAGIDVVRIASVPSIAAYFLPEVFKAVIRQFPHIHIELRDMDSSSVLKALNEGRADLGIASPGPGGAPFKSLPLLSDQFGLVCRHDHPLAQEKEISDWALLQRQPFIANTLCQRIEHPDFQTIYANACLNVPNIISLLAMVRGGLGVSVLPEAAFRLASENVIFIPITNTSAIREVNILYPDKQNIPPAIHFLIREILKACQTEQA